MSKFATIATLNCIKIMSYSKRFICSGIKTMDYIMVDDCTKYIAYFGVIPCVFNMSCVITLWYWDNRANILLKVDVALLIIIKVFLDIPKIIYYLKCNLGNCHSL